MFHTEKWFVNRVGKRIFRDPDTCQCRTCQEVVSDGLIVLDINHAKYLYTIQCDFGSEGVFMNYRDKK